MIQKPVSLISEPDLKELCSHLEGEAFVPGEAGYEQASLSWETLFRQQAAMVVLPATTADVVTAVRFARQHHLPIGIQGGGSCRQATGGGTAINHKNDAGSSLRCQCECTF